MPDHRQKPGEIPSKDENHLHQERSWQQAGGQICCFDGCMQNQCEINSHGHPIFKIRMKNSKVSKHIAV